jgi:hypothetical protein
MREKEERTARQLLREEKGETLGVSQIEMREES